MHPRNVCPPSYSPVGWFSPLNSINFHFPNLISWIFSISLPPTAPRIKCSKIIFPMLFPKTIGEIISITFESITTDEPTAVTRQTSFHSSISNERAQQVQNAVLLYFSLLVILKQSEVDFVNNA